MCGNRWSLPPESRPSPRGGDEKYEIIEGCHECPFLETLAFGDIFCRYTKLPRDMVVDPFDVRIPPRGCPLLDGGTVTVILRQAEYQKSGGNGGRDV